MGTFEPIFCGFFSGKAFFIHSEVAYDTNLYVHSNPTITNPTKPRLRRSLRPEKVPFRDYSFSDKANPAYDEFLLSPK